MIRSHTEDSKRPLPNERGILVLTLFLTLIFWLLQTVDTSAQTVGFENLTTTDLKNKSLEELMEIDVSIVSKRTQRWFETPAEVDVISGEDIRHSGALSLPEALRLSPLLRVAQVNSYGWVITTRGFSGLFANKLLVMVDGRSIYTPLFAGVVWDMQNVLLEDIDRIEIVSGPGGTLWGSNAVNGIINIVTKNSKETSGFHVSGATGSFMQNRFIARYGQSNNEKFSYRISAQRSDRRHTFLANGNPNPDDWNITQGSFRADWIASDRAAVTVQGDYHFGSQRTIPTKSTKDGQNVLARWTYTLSAQSDLTVQMYFDRTWIRDIPSTVSDQLNTYDFDMQHRISLSERHSFVWGAGYRHMIDETPTSTIFVGFLPLRRTMRLYSGFVQDEFVLIPDLLNVTAGTKVEHNDFSHLEIQPSIRFGWTMSDRHMFWGAVTRAIRAPSRIDVDYFLPAFPVPPTSPSVAGGPNFTSEKATSFELGYRIQPSSKASFALTVFHTQYDDLYSVEALPGTLTYQIQNGTEGKSRGLELLAMYKPLTRWRLRGGYTYFHKRLWSKPGHIFNSASLGNDPQHQFSISSMMDLSDQIQFNVSGRYVDMLPDPQIPSYFSFDCRLAYSFEHFVFSAGGQNLWKARHQEFGSEIPRNVYAQLTILY